MLVPAPMPPWTIIYTHAYWPLLALVCIASLRSPDHAVRAVAIAYGAAMALDLLSRPWRTWHGMETGVALIDLALVIALASLVVRLPRWWLTGMTAVQLLETLGHLAKLWTPGMTRLAYAVLVGGGAYVQLTLLSIGLMLAGRTRRLTADRSA